VANVEQAQRWNGEAGRNWIANRERQAMMRERLVPHLLRAAEIGPGDRVLDIGCGCGEATVRAAAKASAVLGLDLSEPMLAVARRLAAEAGVSNVDFVAGDAQVYPFAPGGYDVVISSFGVMFFDDPTAAFANLMSALWPGGRVALLCWRGDEDNELFGIPWRAVSAHLSVPRPADPFAEPGWVADLLTGAGGTEVRVEPVTEPARLGSDVADVVGYFTGPGRIRNLVTEAGDETLLDRIRATMTELFAAHARADGVWVDAAVWLVHGRRG
jgi:SAM-dependent methyltransferase